MDTTKLSPEQIDAIIDKFPGSLEQFLKGAQYDDALVLIDDFENFIEGLSNDNRYKDRFKSEYYANICVRLNKQKAVVKALKDKENN